MIFNQLIDISSADYHGAEGSYSSTQLKDIRKDDELFVKKYVTKEIPREEIAAFDTGTYFHTAILEPEKLKEDCVVCDLPVRRGAAWDAFKAKHAGKAILTRNQAETAEALVKQVRQSPVATQYLNRGRPEVSLFIPINVQAGVIYAPDFKKALTRSGWVSASIPKFKKEDIILKVRADLLAPGYVLDLKSTTGNARDEDTIQGKIKYYDYDLSAALYLDLFSLIQPAEKFFWVFASKDFYNCQTWVASYENIYIGRIKWIDAVLKLYALRENNWNVEDELREIGPAYSELKYINKYNKENLTDLI